MQKYKTSLYTIYVKLEDENHDYLLVHGYTGAVDGVSREVADFLRQGGYCDETDDLAWKLGPGTKDILIKRGYLTDRSPYEEQERVRKMADIFHRRDKTKKSFLFLVAYDCNFRCPYCFENDISNNGKAWSKKVFTKERVDQAYQAMLELEPERGAHIDTIILYGGEPLLKENRDIVAYMLQEGKKRGYNFNAVTNGYDLEHFTDLLGKDAITKLQITIDGSREKHDTRRTHYQTGNSFDKILMNMQVALDQGTTISVRINTDLNNFGELKLLQEEFEQRGFYRYKHFSTYSALIHGESEMSCNVVMSSETPSNSTKKVNTGQFQAVDYGRYIPDAQYINFDSEQERFLQDEPLPSALVFHDEAHNDLDQIHTINRGKYISKYVDAVKENPSMHMVSCQDFGLRGKIASVLQGKGLMSFTSVFCGAQTGMMIFDPYGDMYTCWELVGKEQYKVGTYGEKITYLEEELEHWYGRNIGKTPACSQCKYAFFCGGGCMAGALADGRGYDSPYCDGYPKTFQTVVPQVYKEFKEKRLVVSDATTVSC